MAIKVFLVVQPSLSHYREPFVRALLSDGRLDVTLAARYRPFQGGGKNVVASASADLLSRTSRLTVKRLLGNLVWDHGLFAALRRARRSDVYVLEGSIYNVTTWIAMAGLRICGRKVVLWGHGWKKPEGGLKLALRKAFYKIPNRIFVYGNRAAEFGASVGVGRDRFEVVYNSLYPRQVLDDYRSLERSRGEGAVPLRLIFSGRLSKRHGVAGLAEAVVALRRENPGCVTLTVVGEGEEQGAVKATMSVDLGGVNLVGAKYDVEELASLYEGADFAISPGASGLNVIQALGFGVPVIAESGNPVSGPEIEAVTDENGILYYPREGDSLMDALRRALRVSDEERASLGAAGAELAYNRYSSDAHAGTMADALCRVVGYRPETQRTA